MASTDLIGAAGWCLLSIEMAYTQNSVENDLTRGSTPRYIFEATPTGLDREFKIGWGRPVICSRVRPVHPKQPGTPCKQFGVAVGTGRATGSTWVMFADGHPTWSICLRFHVRELTLGVQRQMSIQEGELLLPTKDAEGNIVLVARGDQGILGKKFALQCDEQLGWEPDASIGEVRNSDMDSSIKYADITEAMEARVLKEMESRPVEAEQ